MAHVFRYPLTRYCLKAGTLTLPRTMLGVFPESGDAVVIDTSTGDEYVVTVANARIVSGFGELFRSHRLAVNDELLIEPLGDGRFAVTATAHVVTVEDPGAAALRRALDELFEAGVPVTEGEARALYDLPADLDLVAALQEDGRFALHEGRWQDAAAVARAVDAVDSASRAGDAPAVHATQTGEEVLAAATHEAVAAAAPLGAAHASPTDQAVGHALAGQAQATLWPAGDPATGADSAAVVQGGSGSGTPDDMLESSVYERRMPVAHETVDAAAPAAAPVGDDDEGASLEATELANRLRRALAPLGYRFEPLGNGQLSLHADMGRRSYRVLVQLLSRSRRLDWADLLARRRALGVRYLAVIGDHRELLRLTNPADLARATLWSWQALDRMTLLHRTVPLSPVELEGHFERDGLFEQGLQRLEATVAKRVGERGAMSEVLARLAVMKSPSVFLLEELAGELDMSRELALRILERLGDAPFHLVTKVDAGEFVLRQRVADALHGVAEYATSLRARLPSRQVERLVAEAEPDLLTDADDIAHAGRARAAEA